MKTIDPADPHPCDVLRPCFSSQARADEFEHLVTLLRQSIESCGLDHGRGVARGYEADCGHDAETLLRVAAAEAARCRR